MKNNTKPSFYYSPYPLKALEQAAGSIQGPQSSHLKALLSDKSKTTSRIRVYPMTNPYKSKFTVLTPRLGKAKEIEPTGKDWFTNYE
jgi:hypothetical protein